MSDTEFGCALSHMQRYRAIIDKGLPGAIILEDDAVPGPLFRQFVDRRLYAGQDLIQLDYGQAFIWKYALGRSRLCKEIHAERLVCNASLLTGYCISARGAQYLLDHGLPISLPADWPCDLRALRPTITMPRLIHHQNFQTSHSYMAERNAWREQTREPIPSLTAPSRKNPRPPWLKFGRRLLVEIITNQHVPTSAGRSLLSSEVCAAPRVATQKTQATLPVSEPATGDSRLAEQGGG